MGLIHWWPLNGDLYDHVQNNHLTYINNNGKLTSNTSGKLGGCWQRTTINTTDALRSTKKIPAATHQSIAAWVYVDTVANTNTANGLITNHDHNSDTGFGLTLKTASPNISYISCNTGNGSSRTYHTYYGTTNLTGAWHHLCGTYDGTHIRLYVDGVCEKLQAYSMAFKEDYIDIFNWSTGYVTTSSYRPACKICDVRIYDHALSPAEVAELKRGLLIHYNFEDYMGQPYTTAYDGSGNELHGIITGVENRDDAATGKHSAYFLSTGSQYITISDPPLNDTNISISMWWKSSNTSPKGGYHILFATKSSSNSYSSVELSVPSSGQLRWGFVINGTRTTRSTTVSPKLNNGAWRHIVLTYDGTTEKAYVDGVQVGSVSTSGTITYTTTSKDTYIGKYVSGSYGATDAYISDMRVYNTTLTQTDITSLYNHTVKVTPDQVMIGNYLVETSSQIDFYDVNAWKIAGHGSRKQLVEDGIELTALNGWESFAITTPSNMIGKKIVFSFDYKWTSETRGNSGECSVWSENKVYYYINKGALMVSDTSTLPTGQWAHVTAVIDSASTYTGFMNRGKDDVGKVYGLICRNFSLQLATESEVKIHPTGVVTTSRYGDSNKVRIIKAGNLTAETFVEI